MKANRRSILMGSLAAILTPLAARAQTPPPHVKGGDLPPGLPQPDETIDLWPNGLPGGENPAISETVIERSKDRLVTDRAVYGITRPRMAFSGRVSRTARR
nr:hypothetical protein [Kordiimonas gwangyangensis]